MCELATFCRCFLDAQHPFMILYLISLFSSIENQSVICQFMRAECREQWNLILLGLYHLYNNPVSTVQKFAANIHLVIQLLFLTLPVANNNEIISLAKTGIVGTFLLSLCVNAKSTQIDIDSHRYFLKTALEVIQATNSMVVTWSFYKSWPNWANFARSNMAAWMVCALTGSGMTHFWPPTRLTNSGCKWCRSQVVWHRKRLYNYGMWINTLWHRCMDPPPSHVPVWVVIGTLSKSS